MSRTAIAEVRGRRVWDSRGRPTVEAEVTLTGGGVGRAIAPAGASTGSGEARDNRDGGAALGGHDVRAAVAAVNEVIAPALVGLDATDQAAVDQALIELDGTPDKARLGGNATIAVSMAVAHAAAAAARQPLWRYLSRVNAPPCRCPRSRSSAAARMPGGGSTSRTSWWSARALRASPRRWTGPPRCTWRRAG